jgi:hypothetical protein
MKWFGGFLWTAFAVAGFFPKEFGQIVRVVPGNNSGSWSYTSWIEGGSSLNTVNHTPRRDGVVDAVTISISLVTNIAR